SAAPPVRGAFAEGGAPAPAPGDAVVARALGTDLPAFMVGLDRRSEARREGAAADLAEADAEMRRARDQALSSDVRDALGPGAARALGAFFDAARSVSGDDGEALSRAASTLDDELASRGLGYFVDADVLTDADQGRRLVLVYTFRVAHVSLFAAGS